MSGGEMKDYPNAKLIVIKTKEWVERYEKSEAVKRLNKVRLCKLCISEKTVNNR